MTLRKSSWMLALLPLVACAEEPAEPDVEPWLELGTGLVEFIPVEDGDEVELVYGPQGGWHVDTSAEFGGVELEGASLVYEALDPDDGRPLNYPYEAHLDASLVQEVDDGWLRLGDRVVFDVDSDAEILGRTIRIELTLRDGRGDELQDTRTVDVVSP